jgi:hypothetical protein
MAAMMVLAHSSLRGLFFSFCGVFPLLSLNTSWGGRLEKAPSVHSPILWESHLHF